MRRVLIFHSICLLTALACGAAPTPMGLVSRMGDKSVVLHWDNTLEPGVTGYNIYCSLSIGGPFVLLNTKGPLTTAGYCHLGEGVINGQTNFYRVTAITRNS